MGVYLSSSSPWPVAKGFPHTRGGVPLSNFAVEIVLLVFPTRVGVYLNKEQARRLEECFPHTRGGVPEVQ